MTTGCRYLAVTLKTQGFVSLTKCYVFRVCVHCVKVSFGSTAGQLLMMFLSMSLGQGTPHFYDWGCFSLWLLLSLTMATKTEITFVKSGS